jgi:hypothetical protein
LIQIIEFITDPVVLIILSWFIAIVFAGIWTRRPKDKATKVKATKSKPTKLKDPLMKQIGKMISDTEKGKELSVPPVRTRQEIITQIFESKMNAINLTPSKDSGHVPVSYTPLSRFLMDRGVGEDTINALLSGLMEVETEIEVRDIIDALADSPEVNLIGNELDKAKELATEEWKNLQESGNA